MRTSSCHLAVLLLSLAALSSAKGADDFGAESEGERLVVRSLRTNGLADLSLLPEKQRSIRAEFLQKVLFGPITTSYPARQLTLVRATVLDYLSPAEQGATASRDLEFSGCTLGYVNFSKVNFEHGLQFTDNSKISQLYLGDVHVKDDLLIWGVQAKDIGALPITLSRARVDGNLVLIDLHDAHVSAQGASARLVAVDGVDGGANVEDFSTLRAEEMRVGASDTANLSALLLAGATIRDTLLLRRATIGKLDASGLHVGGRTDFEGASVTDLLDLTSASLGVFKLREPFCEDQDIKLCWPPTIKLAGVSFRELGVGKYGKPSDTAHSGPDDPLLALEFLGRAEFSESAYSSYELALRTKGQFSEADQVFRRMHGHKRNQLWRGSNGVLAKSVAVIEIVIDRAQSIFLGYGRSALQPLLWSLLFVAIGTGVFWKEIWMEAVGKETPPKYSGFWYSLELFLPVVDLGVAKGWRPARSSIARLTYARIHQLAGWILIPVALAAITGAFK